ncbi:MAG: hypothetical protein WC891_08705 [Actinomycetota bacterium]
MTLTRRLLIAVALVSAFWLGQLAYWDSYWPKPVPVPVYHEWQFPQDEDLRPELQRQAIEIETAREFFKRGQGRDPFKEQGK